MEERREFLFGELDDFLGEFYDEYDIDSIEYAVTELDYQSLKRYWKPNIDEIELFEICEKYRKEI